MLSFQAEEEAGGEVVDVLHADLVAVWSIPQQITLVYNIVFFQHRYLDFMIISPILGTFTVLQYLVRGCSIGPFIKSFIPALNHLRIDLYC